MNIQNLRNKLSSIQKPDTVALKKSIAQGQKQLGGARGAISQTSGKSPGLESYKDNLEKKVNKDMGDLGDARAKASEAGKLLRSFRKK